MSFERVGSATGLLDGYHKDARIGLMGFKVQGFSV